MSLGEITVIDDEHPEDIAMLQALYSRSPDSVRAHLVKVAEQGSGKFMEKFYVGYNHKSIGDCGTTTVFIEGVSMLAAKGIQDWALYSGQEASTRYMDFGEAAFMNPHDSVEGQRIQEGWRALYLRSLDPIREHVARTYPKHAENEGEARYHRAVNARTFDIARSLLPAGAATNLSWHTNLRQAGDKLLELYAHPDKGMRRLGRAIGASLCGHYPHSFRAEEDLGARAQWRRRVAHDTYYLRELHHVHAPNTVNLRVGLNFSDLREWLPKIQGRPRGVELPRQMAEVGDIRSEFLLDFGSFRDVQRHRNGTVRMPLLLPRSMHPWYLEQMPPAVRDDVVRTHHDLRDRAKALDCSDVIRQYYLPMGTLVPVRITQSLPAFIYRIELRSSKTVHPTLRQIVHREIAQFRAAMPEMNLEIHADMDPDSWTLRRGDQTITERGVPAPKETP